MAGKIYHFYVKSEAAYGTLSKEKLDAFKAVIDEQKFFHPKDKVLYIPAEKTELVEVCTPSNRKLFGFY